MSLSNPKTQNVKARADGRKATTTRRIFFLVMAERVGFEPTVPCGTTVFETAPFDHSGTSPEIFLITSKTLDPVRAF